MLILASASPRRADLLRAAGFDLRTQRSDGRQFGFSVLDGRFRGHIDGCLVAGPVALAWPSLWENKTLGPRSWKDVVKRGVVLAKPIYAAQMAFSAWWLQRYRFGPAEWLWRSLTYGQAQPMRAREIGLSETTAPRIRKI